MSMRRGLRDTVIAFSDDVGDIEKFVVSETIKDSSHLIPQIDILHPALTDFGYRTCLEYLKSKVTASGVDVDVDVDADVCGKNQSRTHCATKIQKRHQSVNPGSSLDAAMRRGRRETRLPRSIFRRGRHSPATVGDSDLVPYKASSTFRSSPALHDLPNETRPERHRKRLSQRVSTDNHALGPHLSSLGHHDIWAQDQEAPDQAQGWPLLKPVPPACDSTTGGPNSIQYAHEGQTGSLAFPWQEIREDVEGRNAGADDLQSPVPEVIVEGGYSSSSSHIDFGHPNVPSMTTSLTTPDRPRHVSQGLSGTDRVRSMSFEKHTDEVRQSIRGRAGSSGGDPSMKQTGMPSQSVDPRPRKPKAGSDEVSDQSTSLSNVSYVHPACRDIGQSQFEIQEEKNDAAATGEDASEVRESSIGDSSNQSTMNESPAYLGKCQRSDLTEKVSKPPATSRQSFTGFDTFYSASSDENGGNGDLENVSQAQTDVRLGRDTSYHDKIDRANPTQRRIVPVFSYESVVPESLPFDLRPAREVHRSAQPLTGREREGQPDIGSSTTGMMQLDAHELDPDNAYNPLIPRKYGQYPREWTTRSLPIARGAPPICPPASTRGSFPEEILPLVCDYLSSQEIRNLRLVNRATAAAVLPLMIRSTVIKFGPSLFEPTDGRLWDSESDTPASGSILSDHGSMINRFGISYEFDAVGFATAEQKTIERQVSTWYGDYTWPKDKYPRFSQLKELEDLVDTHRPLLKNAMKNLTNVSELGLCVDSGHGWLDGPDISDLAILRKQAIGGSKLFGKTFDASDRWHEFILRQYFEWGQLNTINVLRKNLASASKYFQTKISDRDLRDRLQVRPYDAFRTQSAQPDFWRMAHVGGEASPIPPQPAAPVPAPAPAPALAPPAPLGNFGMAGYGFDSGPSAHWNAFGMTLGRVVMDQAALRAQQHQQRPISHPVLPPAPTDSPSSRTRPHTPQAGDEESRSPPIISQWPLLFNCYNLAGGVGGASATIQRHVALPAGFSYMPGDLNEAQVQWLMETLWAQRAFLLAYTNSVIANRMMFTKVHSLNIAKLSSGLISALASRQFWSSLPGLENLTLKIVPDWHQEHVAGDKLFHLNMPISPVRASVQLATLLESVIARIERLSVLRIGFVGGGEHQTGLFGRNCHVLPAPITTDPEAWLTDHEGPADPHSMFSFNHIRHLTFENCWFSPYMLKTFMQKSRDTSLHHLTLDSVSLTGFHDLRPDGPLHTPSHGLKCEFSPREWLLENVPRSAGWVDVLDEITPGKTMLDHKYDAAMIDVEQHPRPPPQFRGHVRRITMHSCGYVKISGVGPHRFSQSGLVEQSHPACGADEGLVARKKSFFVHRFPDSLSHLAQLHAFDPARWWSIRRHAMDESREMKMCVMMGTRDPETRSEYFGLGHLTQCVHPVEKRILERAWQMRFGWGDSMDRWAAVEDGWFPGGTGRFSGVIQRDEEC